MDKVTQTVSNWSQQSDRFLFLLCLFVLIGGGYLLIRHLMAKNDAQQARNEQLIKEMNDSLKAITHEQNATVVKMSVAMSENASAMNAVNECLESCIVELRLCQKR